MALQQIGGVEAKSGISRLTTEYLYWRIDTEDDFSNDTASVAFLPDAEGKPDAGDWSIAEIVVDPDDATYSAVRLLVGPDGGENLTPVDTNSVTYRVWIKIETGTETFVRTAGTLLVR